MPSSSDIAIPEALRTLRTSPLFVMRLEVPPYQVIGATPVGFRRVGLVPGGTFEGERLKGRILEGGNDWMTVLPDGSTLLDVRLVLKTDDGAMIAMTYRGIRHGPADVLARLNQGEILDPAQYYSRINPLFETADARYAWLNTLLGIGIGYRYSGGVMYGVFQVL